MISVLVDSLKMSLISKAFVGWKFVKWICAQGIAMLETHGYRPPINAMTNWSGIGTIINAFFGGHPVLIQWQRHTYVQSLLCIFNSF
ncbi:hypothetical protein [Rossellomorea sp. DUT-2]|uniref:hypothetical protein n=1 Tax=Rossellomorea sp. DUT-2 TaxID=3412021 RepID=UPI003D1675A4